MYGPKKDLANFLICVLYVHMLQYFTVKYATILETFHGKSDSVKKKDLR